MAREKPAAGHSGFRKDPGKGRRERLLKPCPPEQRASLFWNAGPCSGVGKEDFFAFFAQSHSKYEQEEQTNMTNLKKKLAVLLALCLMLGALPLSALAARYQLTLADGTTVVGELTTDDVTGAYEQTKLTGDYQYYSIAPGKITVGDKTANLTANYGEAPDQITLPVTATLVEETAALTFTKATAAVDGMEPATVMKDIADPTPSNKTITFTGSAPYVDAKSGHYLLVQITATAGTKIQVGTAAAQTFEGTTLNTAIPMDDSTTGTIAVSVLGANDAVVDTYTIDFTGVALLAKAGNGNTSAPAVDDESGDVIGTKVTDTAGNTVVVPTDSVVDTTEEMVTVAPVTDTTTADKVGIATTGDKKPAEAITSTIVSADKTTLVTVTVTKIDGTPGNQHTADDALASSPLTITIGNLTEGRTYYVFCIRDDGSVTSLGYAKPAGTLISFSTTHLCGFGATDITDLPAADKAALDTAVAATKDEGMTLAAGTEVENPAETETGIQAKFTAKANLTGTDAQTYYYGKLELKDLTADGYYLVAFDNGNAKPVSGSNVYPRTCIVVWADGNGEASMICQPGMLVSVYALHAGSGVPYVIPAEFADEDVFGLDKNNKGTSVNSLTDFTTLAPYTK